MVAKGIERLSLLAPVVCISKYKNYKRGARQSAFQGTATQGSGWRPVPALRKTGSRRVEGFIISLPPPWRGIEGVGFLNPEGLVPLSNRREGLSIHAFLELSFNAPKGGRPSDTETCWWRVSVWCKFQYPEGWKAFRYKETIFGVSVTSPLVSIPRRVEGLPIPLFPKV